MMKKRIPGRHLLLALLLLPTFCTRAQLLVHPYEWTDEYTIRLHIEAIGNILSRHGNLMWKPELGRYVSSIPHNLLYEPAKGKTLCIEKINTAYHIDFTQTDFSAFFIDSIFAKGKKLPEQTKLTYDSLGYLKSLLQKSRRPQFSKSFEEVKVNYQRKNGILIYIGYNTYKNSTNYPNKSNYKYTYSSIYAGDFTGKVKLTSSYQTSFTFNSRGAVEQYLQTGKEFVNGILNCPPCNNLKLTYSWDEKGRPTSNINTPLCDSIVNNNKREYHEKPFDLTKETENYPLLKIPAVKRWLIKEFDSSGLRLITSEKETYLMYNTGTPVLKLDSSVYPEQEIHYTIKDSTSITKLVARVDNRPSNYPDVNDTIPFEPRFLYPDEETVHLQAYGKSHYSKPHGMIPSYGIEGFKRSVFPLKNGWKIISYNRNSASSPLFAIGHTSIRFENYDSYQLFVDENNLMRYFYFENTLCKVNWEGCE
jgi:hypothetical protein